MKPRLVILGKGRGQKKINQKGSEKSSKGKSLQEPDENYLNGGKEKPGGQGEKQGV